MIGELEKKGGRGRSAQFIVKKRYCIQTQQVKIFFFASSQKNLPDSNLFTRPVKI